MKDPKDNIGEYLHDLRPDKDFLNRMQNTLSINEKTGKQDNINIKNSCSSKTLRRHKTGKGNLQSGRKYIHYIFLTNDWYLGCIKD